MDKLPFFSVIIATYNRANKLAKALDSLVKQTYTHFEVIICDSSSDNTKQVVDSYAHKLRLKYLWQAPSGGPARGRNAGLNLAEGEYAAFLDSDDYWYPEKLAYIIKNIQKGDIIYHSLNIINRDGKKTFGRVRTRQLKGPVFIDLMTQTNTLFPSAVVVKKSLLEKAGGFTEEDTFEDFDLWLRLSRLTDKFYYIPEALGAYFLSDENRSGASERAIEQVSFVYRKYFKFLNKDDYNQAEAIMYYLLGRIKQRMGLHREARGFFGRAFKIKSLNFKLRAICWLTLLSVATVKDMFREEKNNDESCIKRNN